MTEADSTNSSGREEVTGRAKLKEDTERWLIRQGLPHLVKGYRSPRDVITSATPSFIVVFFLEIFFLEFDLLFSDRYHGGIQFVVLLGSAVFLLLVIMGVNKLRGRRLMQLPSRLGVLELGVFLLVPSLLAGFDRGFLWSFFWVLLLNLLLAGLLYLFASYALLPMLRWGVVFMLRQLGNVLQLTARALPLLLLISFFVFLNAEMWQVANDFKLAHYLIMIGLIAFVGIVFFSFSIPEETRSLMGFDTWKEVISMASKSSSPLVSHSEFWAEVTEDKKEPESFKEPLGVGGWPVRAHRDKDEETEIFTPLTRGARANLMLLVFFAAFVRVTIVGMSIGVFFGLVGMLAVGEETILQWTTNMSRDDLNILFQANFLDRSIIITVELLYTSGLIATLSALQFALLSMTNDNYKKQFFADIENEVRRPLAVRELYIRYLDR